MLTGKELGEALAQAMKLQGVITAELARAFKVRSQSVNDWKNYGRIDKKHLPRLFAYFAPTVGPEHWGLERQSPLWSATNEQATGAVQKAGSNDLVIRRWDAGGSMGRGVMLPDQPGVIDSWTVSPDWLRLNVRGHTTARQLAIVTGFGDSMRPLFNPGDPLLLDTSVTEVLVDGVYFFRVGDEGFIKRLQRIPGEGLRVLSDNRELYEPWTIRQEMDFAVFGRVLKVWRSDDF